MIKKTDGGVTAAKGFEAIGIAAGIKKGKKDMALIYSRIPCEVACHFHGDATGTVCFFN